MAAKKCFPDHITKLLKNKGYYELTQEQRVNSHSEALTKLKEIPHINYEAGREALRELRGQS